MARSLLEGRYGEGLCMETVVGFARRIRVRMPLLAVRGAWDCRAFGWGRIVAPRLRTRIEIAPGIQLDLWTGEVRARSGRASNLA